MMTAHHPMKSIMPLAHEIEARPGVINVTFSGGFPPSDTEDTGVSCLVTTANDMPLARKYANELARFAWSVRDGFLGGVTSFADAAKAISALPDAPATTATDRRYRRQHLVRRRRGQRRTGPFFPGPGRARRGNRACRRSQRLFSQLREAGIGASIDMVLGGKIDAVHGAPLPCTADGHQPDPWRLRQRGDR